MRRFSLSNGMVLVLLVALGLIGISLKLLSGVQPPENHDRDLTRLALTIREHAPDLELRDRANLTREGAYQALLIGRMGCDGALALVPLYRNAEGVVLLDRLSKGRARTVFLLGDQAYDSFPAVRLWWRTLTSRLVGVEQQPLPLLGLAEFGDCGVTESLRQTLTAAFAD